MQKSFQREIYVLRSCANPVEALLSEFDLNFEFPRAAVLASQILLSLALQNGLAFVIPINPRAAAIRNVPKQRGCG
jgi:hypothetical protein